MDPVARLAELLREVSRHRDAIQEFRLSANLEVEGLEFKFHTLELRSVYEQIRKHCGEHGLLLPRDVPRDGWARE